MEENKMAKVNVSDEDKVFSILAYFNVLCLVSALVKKNNDYVIFHVKQGMVLFVVETLSMILLLIPIIGFFAFAFVMFVLGIVSIIGMVYAFMGVKFEMPIVETYAKKMTL